MQLLKRKTSSMNVKSFFVIKDNLFNSFRNLMLVTLFLTALIMVVFNWEHLHTFKGFSIAFAWSFCICFTQTAGHVWINKVLNQKFDWLKQAGKRTIWGAITTIIYAELAYITVQLTMFKIIYNKPLDVSIQWALESSYTVMIIAPIVVLVSLTIAFFQSWKKSIIQSEQLKTQMMAYKYEALQNQINPHFLFNSFNVLSDLVYEDQAKAVKFIQQLSKLFRYVLDNRDKELVPLFQEEKFIRSYGFLIQNRFEDKLKINIDMQAQEDDMMVPMALQVVVENCIKHNIVSSKQPLHITISRSGNYLHIVNNLQEKENKSPSNNMGLSNIKQQYQFFTDDPLVITKTENTFEVRLPILKLKQ